MPLLNGQLEPAGDARDYDLRLPATVRHLLQERGKKAQCGTLPKIRDPNDVEQNEPAASHPDLAALSPLEQTTCLIPSSSHHVPPFTEWLALPSVASR